MKDKIEKDPRKNPDVQSHQGNNLGLLFLVIPIAFLIWAFRTGTVFPIDQVDFLIKSAVLTGVSFVVLWVMTFHKTEKSRVLYAISAFLLMLWCIGGLAGISKINTTWDESAEKIYYMKATEVRTLSSSSGRMPSRPSCMVRIEKKTLNVDVMWIKYHECDSIRSGVDGLLVKVKDGTLGMPWMADHSIIKDYDLYKARLGITD